MDRQFQIIEGSDFPISRLDGWRQLAESMPGFGLMHEYSWYRTCVDHLEKRPESAFVVFAYRQAALEAVFPFIKEEHSLLGIKRLILRSPMHGHINLHDIVLDPNIGHEDLMTDLFAFLRTAGMEKCDVIRFGNVLEDSASMRLLQGVKKLRTSILAQTRCNSLAVQSEEELRKSISKNLKGNLRKAHRKLSDCGSINFLATRDPVLLPEYFQKFLQVEASGWKGAGGAGSAILLNPQLMSFYGTLVDYFGAEGQCEINLLEVNNKVIAGQFGLIAGNTLFLLKIGYDEAFAKLTPGHILLEDTLGRLSAEGKIRNVNLITDAAWHVSWRPKQETVVECCCYSPGIGGTAMWVLRYLRRGFGAWYRVIINRTRAVFMRLPAKK